MFEVQRSTREDDVRVTTAFKRMLGFAGASVKEVAFGTDGVVVTVALHARKRPVCSGCGARVWGSRSTARSAGGILISAPAAATSSAG